MNDHPSRPGRGFRLGPEPPPEEEEILLQEETVLKPPRIGRADIRRLNRRVNIFTLLLPILLIALVLLGYLDIKRRVSQTQDNGSAQVLNLSKDLESSFSSLSVKQAELAEALDKQKAANRKARAGLAARLEKTRKSVAQLSAVVAGRKKRLAEIERLRREMYRVSRRLESLDTAVKGLQKTTLDRLAALEKGLSQTRQQAAELAVAAQKAFQDAASARQAGAKMRRRIEVLQADLKGLTNAKLDRKMLRAAMQVEALHNQKELSALAARLDEKISALQRQISLLSTFGTPGRAASQGKKGATRGPSWKFLEQDIKR